MWLTREPLPGEAWRPRTWHRYAYAFASPISYYDAYGLQGGCPLPTPVPVPTPLPVTPTPVGTPVPQGAADGGCLWKELRAWLRYYVGYLIGPPIPTGRVELYTDPNNPYDLTAWLLEQMRVNATSPLGQQLRAYYPWPGVWIGWYRLVKAGGVWDFKPDLLPPKKRSGENIVLLMFAL